MEDIQSVKLCFFDLPPEIINIIYNNFKKIKDLKTLLNIRQVCREWWKIDFDLNYYDDNNVEILYKFILKPTVFKKVLNSGFVTKKIVFEPYGVYKSIEHNTNRKIKKIIVNNPPYEISMYEKKFNTLIIRKVNLLTGENIFKTQVGKCISVYNPFIDDPDYIFPNHNNNIPEIHNQDVGCLIS